MSWIDCGLNLHSNQFKDKTQVLESAENVGVTHFVLISSDLKESQTVVEYCQSHSQCIATVGVHPHQADQVTVQELDLLKELASQSVVRAIGECGLDYNRNFSEPAQQRRVFAKQVEIATEFNLPLYLHERDAIDDQIAILEEHKEHLPPLLVHCFTQGMDALERYMEFDVYFGITGWVCDERRGKALQEAVPHIPANRILIETDAPYLQPRTLKPKPQNRMNYPHYLPHIGEFIARLRNEPLAEFRDHAKANTERLFGTWGAV